MIGTTALAHSKRPRTLTAIVASQCSPVISSNGVGRGDPSSAALLTSTWIAPYAASTAATNDATSSVEVTSTMRPIASPPARRTASTTGEGSRTSHTPTRAPSAASARAKVAPRPCAAPVTIAVLPLNRFMGSAFAEGRRGTRSAGSCMKLLKPLGVAFFAILATGAIADAQQAPPPQVLPNANSPAVTVGDRAYRVVADVVTAGIGRPGVQGALCVNQTVFFPGDT